MDQEQKQLTTINEKDTRESRVVASKDPTHCTASKAAGFLSCLQMKIVSFGMKPK